MLLSILKTNKQAIVDFLPQGFLAAIIATTFTLSFPTFVQAEPRVLDLAAVGPEDFSTDLSEHDRKDLQFLLPPMLEGMEVPIGTDDQSNSRVEFGLSDQIKELESDALVEITGEFDETIILQEENSGVPQNSIEQISYSEFPIIATHRVMGVAHRCTSALQTPASKRWIFWRKECQPQSPGPVYCSLQHCFVNWRLSSTYLNGCIPEGYSLSHFIESSINVEFHNSTLSSDDLVDRGGSLEDAHQIEGENSKTIQELSIDITPPAGELPVDQAEDKFSRLPMQLQLPGTHRLWCGTSFYWDASLLNHQPLYFEDINLERHGFSRGCLLQPLVSGAKFFVTLPALPYLMAADPPHETSFTLGQTRPGSHACYFCERPRMRLDAATVEAAAVVGLVFLIP